MELTDKNKKNFLRKVAKSNKNSWNGIPCLEWTGSFRPNGYGQIGINHKMESTHRISWIIFKGDIPEGMCVLHRCDNRKCVNVEHLFLGTYQDNADDKVQKGRQSKGEDRWISKLKERDVINIRKWFESKKYTKEELSKKFNVGLGAIDCIITRKTWKHVR